MTIKQELERLEKENDVLHSSIEYLQDRLETVSGQRDSYAQTLQEVCINLSKECSDD